MPHVQITLIEGRATEQKRKAAKRVTEVLCEELSCPPDAVSISFVDVPKDSFARGGVLMLDKGK
jgi:4-oxalocrotonate tautomerase